MIRTELLQNAKPILFNTEMVRAILDGRKTCTRRLVKFLDNRNPNWSGYVNDGLILYNGNNQPCNKAAPYKLGDILYVRETWQYAYELDGNENIIEDTGRYYYAADDSPFMRWRPSIHMPKEAARIFLRVTDVKVERLQDITVSQSTKEGCVSPCRLCRNERDGKCVGDSILLRKCPIEKIYSPFIELWDSTIKKSDLDKYGWDANPWVFVISFERIDKDETV